MDILKKYLSYKLSPVYAATIVAALIIGWCIFLFPVGMADNGDFFRIINDQRIYYLSPDDSDNQFNYFIKDYGIRQYNLEYNTNFISTHSIAIWLATKLSVITGGNKTFDIRYLAIIYTVVYLFSMFFILKRFMHEPENRKVLITNWVKAALFTIIFTDIGYILYFNSFFGESFSYVFLLLTLATIIFLIDEAPKTWHIPLFLFSSLMFIGAKQQNAPLGVLLGIFAIRLFWLNKETAWRVWAIASGVILTLSTILLYTSISSDVTYINQYHTVTRGIQNEAKDIGADTDKLGLPKRFALLKDTNYYDGYPVVMPDGELMRNMFYAKYSFAKVAAFYFSNPPAMVRQLEKSMKAGFDVRPKVLGNYQKSYGKPPKARTFVFSSWSVFKQYGLPSTLGFVSIMFSVIYIFTFIKYFFAFKDRDLRAQLECESIVLIGALGISQVFLAFIGAGDADLAKHLFLFYVSFDLLFMLLVINVLDHYFVRKLGIFKK